MNTEQLKTFLSLVETGNFSRSAEKLIVAQSTISKRISDLEQELGKKLFIRDRSGTALTNAGRILLEYAEQIVNTEEKALTQIHRKDQFAGYLVLGTVYAYFPTYLCGILQTFMEHHSDISIQVKFGHTSQIISDTRRALLDIAFTHHPFDHPEYSCQLVAQDDVILVTDAKNNSYSQGITHEKIQELPFISSNFLYHTTHNWLFPSGQQFQLELEVAQYALPLLKNTGYYTLLARKLVEKELQAGTLIEIPLCDIPIPPVQYYMIYRKTNVQQIAIREWIHSVQQFCQANNK